MYVIVVGAGEVGTFVAERLSNEGHDVAMVEKYPGPLRAVSERLDVLTMLGSGTNPEVLRSAGVDKAELVVAVTSSDEVNLVACLVAKQAGIARTVCRLEDPALRSRQAAGIHEAMGVDLIIDPDFETAQEILDLLDYPGASAVAEMAGGEVVVIGAQLASDAPVVGRSLQELAADYDPEWDFLFGVISRGDETIIPRGDVRLAADDVVRVLCKRRGRRELMRLLGLARRAPRRIMLLGGGRTAELVAVTLDQRGSEVVIVERDPDRAEELAAALSGALVINGEITDSDLLDDNDVGGFDVVIALTGEDDANVLACLFARLAGAEETIAVVHRLSLLPLVKEAGIDVALSPRTASASGVLRYVRGDVSAVATFLQDQVEVIELEVKANAPADGGAIADLDLPHDVLVGAYVRDGKAQIARGRSQLRNRDHVVLFAMPGAAEDLRRVFG